MADMIPSQCPPETASPAVETKSGEIRFDGVSRSWIHGASQIVDDPPHRAADRLL
jgi:hypothetical protein